MMLALLQSLYTETSVGSHIHEISVLTLHPGRGLRPLIVRAVGEAEVMQLAPQDLPHT